MKILFWQWNAFMQKGIVKALDKLNIEYDVFSENIDNWEKNDAFKTRFSEALLKSGADAVFSVNFNPIISNVCNERNIKYISWVYDAPLHIRDDSTLFNACNEIYFFDRQQALEYQNRGCVGARHLALAADESVWEFKNDTRYNCDVALVGKLYTTDYNYLSAPLDMYYRGVLEGILAAQGVCYGAYLIDELLGDDLMKELNEIYSKSSKGKFKPVEKREVEFALASEVTGRERAMALSLLASRCDVHLHSSDKTSIDGLKQLGYVDYYSEMPSVFRNAKINLNISLRAIKSGIPLRVMDVLSCGGFLITNYQEELFDYFEPGVDLVVYEDVADLVRKVDYYLNHEDERMAIARNGYNKVRELCNFEARLGEIFK